MPSSVSQSSASAGLPPSSLAARACQSARVFSGKSAISAFLPQPVDYNAAPAASSIDRPQRKGNRLRRPIRFSSPRGERKGPVAEQRDGEGEPSTKRFYHRKHPFPWLAPLSSILSPRGEEATPLPLIFTRLPCPQRKRFGHKPMTP